MKKRRERRLERMVLVSKLKLVMAGSEAIDADVRACLGTLRDGLNAGMVVRNEEGEEIGVLADHRERRLSAEALVDFHLKTSQLGAKDGTTVNIDHLGDQTVQVFDKEGMLAALRDGEFRAKALDAPGHEKNGEASDE